MRAVVAGLAFALMVPAAALAADGENTETSPEISLAGNEGPEGTTFWDVYEDPPADAEPGDIRWVQSRQDAPPGAKAWNVVYVSEIMPGVNRYVSGEVYTPAAPSGSPRDVVLWNHETTGLPDNCAPSRRSLLGHGDRPRVPAIHDLLDAGYVVAMSDYPGQALPGAAYYMVGEVNARASLDMLRAVRSLPDLNVSDQFVQYGWSQGGQTSMHVEAIAASYAPELTGLGSALIAPAVRIRDLTLNSMRSDGLAGYVIATLRGIQAAYPDLRYRDFLRNEAMEMLPVLADGCFDMWDAGSSLRRPYRPRAMTPGSAWSKAMAAVDDFDPAGTMPFVIYQGADDTTTPPELTRRERDALCEAGSAVMYHEMDGRNHGSIVPVAAERFPRWAADRFAGEPARGNCPAS
ncbi:lipase family protein [Haloechinothrix halophila]|uniref:lipase family protein n=1 Tax=Haloechinothrix halophila TaxID=1069073 RepID=UPI0003F92289|nr:lipase family protein [Haloechinothrix halophila]